MWLDPKNTSLDSHIELISAFFKLKYILLVWLETCPEHQPRNKGI